MDTREIAVKAKLLAREGFRHTFGKPAFKVPDHVTWEKVRGFGTRLWLDTGDIEEARELWNSSFEALTTNNTLLNKEVQKGGYDELVKKWAGDFREAEPEMDETTLVLEIAFVLNAYHALRLVETFDANVSVELHTDLANDVERTVAYGKRYYDICPERFFVKVPLTPAGFLAARKLRQAGIPVNFTLGFSARQNYLAALLTRPAFVNVFMGRLNAFAADNKLGDGNNVGEKATLSTQREILKLRREERTDSLLIGASMREGAQAASLAGLDVFTMPVKVAKDYVQNPAAELADRTKDDPAVTAAQGVQISDFYGSSLWLVPQHFKDAVDALLKKNLDRLSPEDLQSHFAEAGLGDFLPEWTPEDVNTVLADGKIPVYDHWRDRLKNHEIGLDALMNLSALYSFASDQKKLDDRIRSLL